MKKTFLLIVSVIYSLLFVGCQNSFFQTVTSRFSAQKPEGMTPSEVETFNTAQINKDLQSVYERNWKEEFSENHANNTIQQVAFEKPSRLPRNVNGHLTISELLNRAEGAKRSGNISEAVSYYHAILKKNQRHPVAHHQLAVIADKQRDYQTSEFHYHAALREKNNNPDLYSDLGYSYLTQNKLQEAESYLQQALRLRPSHQLALNNLGILYARTGDRDRALNMFRRTGTEQEAQQKLATIVSQNNTKPQSNTETKNVYHQQIPKITPKITEPKPIQQVDDTRNRQAESVAELRKRMNEIRRKASEERNRKSQNRFFEQQRTPPARLNNVRRTIPVIRDNSPYFAQQQKQYPQKQRQQQQYPQLNRPPYSRNVDPRLLQQIRTRRLPDSRLNDAFRAIEQGNQNRTEKYQPSPRSIPRRTINQHEHRLLAPQERERQDTNPLNSMKEWNPSVGQVEQKQQPHQQASHHTTLPRSLNQRTRSSYLPQEYYSHKNSPSLNKNRQQATQQQAARLGMSEGLNGMLPSVEEPRKKSVSTAHRSLPGSNLRMGGVGFTPSQSYDRSGQRNGIQQSRYQQKKGSNIDAIQRDSALYRNDRWAMESNQKNHINGHHQQYLMQQNERRQQQHPQGMSAMNRDFNRYSQHLSRQPIPQGNGTFSPQLGQYYGPDQYRKATSNFNGSTTSWK